MYMTQGIHRSVQTDGDGLATSFRGRKRTWSQFAGRVARLAGALRALGVRPGDRVAMLSQNSDRFVEYFYAVFWIGAVATPVNIRWSLTEILYSLDDCTPSVLLFEENFIDHAAALRQQAKSLTRFIFAGDGVGPDWAEGYETLIAESEPVADCTSGGDALAMILYTGGTTGFPKGVMISHRSLVCSTLLVAQVAPPDRKAITVHTMPMFHIGSTTRVFRAVHFGSALEILPRFAPELVIEALAAGIYADIALVPTMLGMLLDHSDAHGGDISPIRHLFYGAAPMPEALLRRAMTALPHASFYQAYGQTELSVVTMLEPEFHGIDKARSKLRSAGRALPGVDVKIAAVDGSELERCATGEIWVRSPSAMMRYWNRPDTTAETMIDGWVRTGDAGYMDADGFLFVVDRVKDMIISGGENIYSVEVENAILKHAAVRECAVIGAPDDRLGERVHAILVLREGHSLTLEQLSAHCAPLVGGYKRPRSLEIRRASLPLSAAGKVLKSVLRDEYRAKARLVRE